MSPSDSLDVAVAPARRRFLRAPEVLQARDFRRFWIGESVSLFGDQITLLALPLVGVLTLHASPAQMGYLGAALLLPNLLFSLHAGAWVDRRGHRRVTMLGTALGRAGCLLTIPLAYWLGILTMAQLYVVSFLIGTLSVFFFVSYSTLFVSLVPREPVHRGDLAPEQQPRDVLHRRSECRRPARAGVLGARRDPHRRVLLPRLGALAEVDLAGRAADREGRARAPEGRRPLHLALAGHPLEPADDDDDQLLQLRLLGDLPALREPHAGCQPGRARARAWAPPR